MSDWKMSHDGAFYLKMGMGITLYVRGQIHSGGYTDWVWMVYENQKRIMHGDADTSSQARKLAEDAYRQWQGGRPKMLFNPEIITLPHGKIRIEWMPPTATSSGHYMWFVSVKTGAWMPFMQLGLAKTRTQARGQARKLYNRIIAMPRLAGHRTLFNGIDENMKKKGYRWKLTPRSGRFEPLYAKTTATAASLLREYPDDTFDVIDLSDGKRKKPRMLFNAGWIDVGSMGHQREFPDKGLAVVEKVRAPRRGWLWSVYVWMAGDSSIRMGRPGLYGPVKAGWAEVIDEAKKDAEKAYRSVSHKHPRTLFNPRLVPARWWMGKREDGTWDLQKAKSAMRFPWINVLGPFSSKKEAVKEAKRRGYVVKHRTSPRMLFNSRRESMSPVTKVLGIWTYRYGLSGIRRRDPHRDSIDFADEFDLTTHEMLKLEIAMREAIERLRYPTKPGLGGHRTLFNPTQEMLRHGKIVVERVKIPRDEAQRLRRTYGWGWRVYITMGHMLGKLGDNRLYGPVASGLSLRRSKAVEDSRKAYRNVIHKHPRTLFNAVRR